MFWRIAGALMAFQAGVSTAVVNNQCTGESQTKIDDGITDAIKMANTAIQTIQTKLSDDIFGAPFFQLFPDGTQDQVVGIYSKVADIRSSAQVVTFYCDENHITWRDDLNSWADSKYTYASQGRTLSLVYNMHVGDSSTKPGKQNGGSSYTTLGYKVKVGTNFADCSDQAHIFISDQRLNPPDGQQDTRPIDTIVENGLDARFNSLDSIRPLSQTILHELVHAVGGWADNARLSASAAITDGPNESVYGLGACFQANVNAAQLPGSIGTLNIADPYAVLAKEYYLQPKKNAFGEDHTGPTIWILGAVTPDTLEPIVANTEN